MRGEMRVRSSKGESVGEICVTYLGKNVSSCSMIATIIAWIVLGLVAGWLGKLIMPGEDPGGLPIQLGLGIGGAFLGGFLWKLLGGTAVSTVGVLPGLGDILVATVGAVILLAIYRFVKKQKS